MKDLNKSLYATTLRDDWAKRTGLIDAEAYLFGKYLTDCDRSVLEAGTAGGRLVFELEKVGFSNITAFDYVPEMIDAAIQAKGREKSNVNFMVADARDLSQFASSTFDYLIYLQQVLSCIPLKDDFDKALAESYRITKKDGLVLFSFLDFDGRRINPYLSAAIKFVRKLRGTPAEPQLLPWLKLKGKPNWKFFNRNQAVNYWVKKNVILAKLKSLGFEVVEVTHSNALNHQPKKAQGMLYIVCKKLA